MRKLSLMLCILWMGFIFYNSSKSGIESNNSSMIVLGKIKDLIKYNDKVNEEAWILHDENINCYNESSKELNNKNNDLSYDIRYGSIKIISELENIIRSFIIKEFKNFNNFIRKSAHTFEFLILAVLLSWTMFNYRIRWGKGVIYILIMVLFYAITDEVHQLFVPERGASITDVLIDFIGGIIGVILFNFCYYGKRLLRVVGIKYYKNTRISSSKIDN